MLNKNQIITGQIVSYGSGGEGVMKYQGYPVFVPFTIADEVVRVRILKNCKSHAFGKIECIVTPSPSRVSPPCPVFTRCGGCKLLHMKYEEGLSLKQQKLKDQLSKIAKISWELPSIIPCQSPFRHRYKSQIPALLTDNEMITGFYAPHSNRIVKTADCLMGQSASSKVTSLISSWAAVNRVPLRHIYIRQGHATGEMMVSLISKKKLPNPNHLVSLLLAEDFHPFKITSIINNINKSSGNVIIGDKIRVHYGNDFITDRLCGLNFKLHHNSFYQINPQMAQEIYQYVLKQAAPTSQDCVLDLYCGIGTLSLVLAKHAGRVVGVECVPEAVSDASYNAGINNITNATFMCQDAEELNCDSIREIEPNIVILDPPRRGVGTRLLQSVTQAAPRKILYVSCDSGTLSRDIAFLTTNGYKLKDIRIFDQFCFSHHLETVAILEQKI